MGYGTWTSRLQNDECFFFLTLCQGSGDVKADRGKREAPQDDAEAANLPRHDAERMELYYTEKKKRKSWREPKGRLKKGKRDGPRYVGEMHTFYYPFWFYCLCLATLESFWSSKYMLDWTHVWNSGDDTHTSCARMTLDKFRIQNSKVRRTRNWERWKWGDMQKRW